MKVSGLNIKHAKWDKITDDNWIRIESDDGTKIEIKDREDGGFIFYSSSPLIIKLSASNSVIIEETRPKPTKEEDE